jgi:hypothetical protein
MRQSFKHIIFNEPELFNYLYKHSREEQRKMFAIPDTTIIYLNNVNVCIDLYFRMLFRFHDLTKSLKEKFEYENQFILPGKVSFPIIFYAHCGKIWTRNYLERKCRSELFQINYTLTPETAEEFEPFYQFLLKRIPQRMTFKLGYHNAYLPNTDPNKFYEWIQYLQTFITPAEMKFIWQLFLQTVRLKSNLPPDLLNAVVIGSYMIPHKYIYDYKKLYQKKTFVGLHKRILAIKPREKTSLKLQDIIDISVREFVMPLDFGCLLSNLKEIYIDKRPQQIPLDFEPIEIIVDEYKTVVFNMNNDVMKMITGKK